ncbi:MAG: bifunctional riboflavin kinase/FAD synthetase [Agriterribacter sp.]
MQIHQNISALPSFRNPVITIGTFDGVHTGHKQIINQLKQEAAQINGETVIITFYPHPRKVVSPRPDVMLLNTPEEKTTLLDKEGIDHLVVVPFTPAFAEQTAAEYISHFLVGQIKPHTIIIGYDHRFGKNREGDYLMLEACSTQYGFIVKEISEKILHEAAVSSTRIRQALSEGDIQTANELLGYDYFFEGKVVEGNKLGRTIGYPTANIEVSNTEKLIPANGVYAVEVKVNNRTLKGMMNIGVRPTINGTKRTIEVNIFDFDEDIYGADIQVLLKFFLRAEQKFNGLDALKAQLAKDKENATDKLNA